MMLRRKKILVFGVFDKLHPGHRDFLRQAKKHGDELIVVVARDAVVRKLKHKYPSEDEATRQRNVSNLPEVSRVILGDEEISTYKILRGVKPDSICLGYDQDSFEHDLMKCMEEGKISRVPIIRLKPYRSEEYHTSVLDKNNK